LIYIVSELFHLCGKLFEAIVIDNVFADGTSYDIIGDAHIGIVCFLSDQSIHRIGDSEIETFGFYKNHSFGTILA